MASAGRASPVATAASRRAEAARRVCATACRAHVSRSRRSRPCKPHGRHPLEPDLRSSCPLTRNSSTCSSDGPICVGVQGDQPHVCRDGRPAHTSRNTSEYSRTTGRCESTQPASSAASPVQRSFASPAWRWDAGCAGMSAGLRAKERTQITDLDTNPLKSQTLILSTSAALTDLYRPTHPAQYDDRTAKDWHSCRGQHIVSLSATREGVLCEAPLPRLESCRWRHTIEPSSYAGRHGALAPHQRW